MTQGRKTALQARSLRTALAVFLLFLGVQVGLQLANHAYASEFGRTWDEAAHYVTGLMVREFIAGGDWSSPMSFAEDYYLHYPKVAIGHWPPGFYALQAAWTLVFPPSRASMMLFMACLTSLLATTVCLVVRPHFGRVAGLGAGLLLLALPGVQTSGSAVMAEVPLALLALWAALAFGRYLDTGGWRWSLAFAVLASLAILFKANGLALALVPPLAVLLGRRFRLLTRPSFWFPAGLVALLCGPWYWLTLRMLQGALFVPFPHFASSLRSVSVYSKHLVGLAGLGVLAFAVLGLIGKTVGHPRAGHSSGKWAALGALGLAVVLFLWIAPVDFDPRHLVPVGPVLVVFTVAGLSWAGERLPVGQLSPQARTALLAVLALVLFSLEAFRIPRREWRGFGPVAAAVLEEAGPEIALFLVSSDPLGEGAFVAEVARRLPRPRHVVLRGSKVLSKSGWVGTDYRLLYRNAGAVEAFLSETGVDHVIVDQSVEARRVTPDLGLLETTLRENPDGWSLVGSFPVTRDGRHLEEGILLYSRAATEAAPVREIELDLRQMLGRRLRGSVEAPERPEG